MVAQFHAPCRRAVYQTAGSGRRHLMLHRGPLENRRRLGKRNLTGAMHPDTHQMPSWYFQVLSSPTAWQWQGPTTPQERRIKAGRWTISNIWRGFLAWLEMSEADKPFIIPPADMDLHQSFSTTLADLRLDMSSLTAADADAAHEICRTFCSAIQDRILAGELTVEQMLLSLEPFDTASHHAILEMRIGDKISAMIRSSIAEALKATELSRPGVVSQEMWTAMFAFVTAINGNGRFHDVSCFNNLITAMPASIRSKLPNETLINYLKSFIYAQASRSHLHPAWSWCSAKVGTALAHLPESQKLALSTSVDEYASNNEFDAETKMRVSFAWLLTHAYDALLTDGAFVALYNKTNPRRMDPSGYRVWQLAVARLHSKAVISKEACRQVDRRDINYTLPQRWTTLIQVLLATEKPQAAIASLTASLADIGETWHLINGLMHAHAEIPCAELLRTVADSSNKLNVLLPLHIAANDSTQGGMLLGPWTLQGWQQHFDAFMTTPKAESHVWRAIKADGGDREVKVHLIDLLSSLYLASPHLSKSQKMRRLQRAAAYQKALTGTVSRTVVRNAVSAVTLDLDDGLLGRDRLLRWATRLVRDFVGTHAAHKMEKELDGWRHLIRQTTAKPAATEVAAMNDGEHETEHHVFDFSGVKRIVEEELDDEVGASGSTRRGNRFVDS